MYVDIVPNRKSPPAILLRESYWKDGKAKKRTLLNLTPHMSLDEGKALKAFLGRSRKGAAGASRHSGFEITRTLPHGHVHAVLGTARKLGLPRLLAYRPCRERDLVVAMIVQRIVGPRSKLATARALDPETAIDATGELLELGPLTEDELYEALDWLGDKQTRIEDKLAKRHLQDGVLVLYDVTSTYFEGRTCELARIGYSRDGKKNSLQTVIGLLCNREGCPIAVEVFEGNTADPATVASQVRKVRERFGLTRVVFVGDRGMLTSARIREDLEPAEFDWISALRSPQIRKLVAAGGPLQPSLFDETDHVEIVHPEFPGERLVACRNPPLARKRARKREELLEATEMRLAEIEAATKRDKRRLTDPLKIADRAGRVLGKSKVAKHFTWEVNAEGVFVFERDEDKIAREAALDGIYVVRTSVSADLLTTEQAVGAYKGLSVVERAFRHLKTSDLQIRPIHHRKGDRVRAHVLLCMLAYYVEWHMRRKLAPILFHDHAPETAERDSIVSPARRSDAANDKAANKRTEDGWPVLGFRDLLDNLGTIARNRIQPSAPGVPAFNKTTQPTPFQEHAFALLDLKPLS